MNRTNEVYIFSCLSEESLQLGFSIHEYLSKRNRKCIISYSSFESDFMSNPLLVHRAKSIGADISRFDLFSLIERYKRFNQVHVFLLSRNEQANLTQTVNLHSMLISNSNFHIYCKASSIESECIIDNINITNHARGITSIYQRIYPERTEIYHWFDTHSIFEYSQKILDEKWINCVCIGYGKYGSEFLKAFLWCGQMDNFFLRADIFDTSPAIMEQFAYECPGIIERGNEPRMGEDYYDLHFHHVPQYNSVHLIEELNSITNAAIIIVDVGSEIENVSLALRLRSYYSGRNIDAGEYPDHTVNSLQVPHILAVVHTDSSASLIDNNSLKNFKNQHYQIECIGKLSSEYSTLHLVYDPLLYGALQSHLQYGKESDFWNNEYFRRSSMASSIHKKYREQLLDDQTVSAMVEHRRWCAYMRSTEGYCYGITRDDLAKRHPSLTAYDNLSKVEQAKDFAMNNVEFTL